MTTKSWPNGLQTRTAEEWTHLGATWSDPESRTAIMDALKQLGIPASEYVKRQPPQRAELLIELQEAAKPGSTKAGGAAKAEKTEKTAAKTAAPAKRASAPKPAAAPQETETSGGGGGTVDLTPVLAAVETLAGEVSDLNTKIEQMVKRQEQIFVALRIMVLSNPTAQEFLEDGDTVRELAAGNLSPVFDEGNGD